MTGKSDEDLHCIAFKSFGFAICIPVNFQGFFLAWYKSSQIGSEAKNYLLLSGSFTKRIFRVIFQKLLRRGFSISEGHQLEFPKNFSYTDLWDSIHLKRIIQIKEKHSKAITVLLVV